MLLSLMQSYFFFHFKFYRLNISAHSFKIKDSNLSEV